MGRRQRWQECQLALVAQPWTVTNRDPGQGGWLIVDHQRCHGAGLPVHRRGASSVLSVPVTAESAFFYDVVTKGCSVRKNGRNRVLDCSTFPFLISERAVLRMFHGVRESLENNRNGFPTVHQEKNYGKLPCSRGPVCEQAAGVLPIPTHQVSNIFCSLCFVNN